MASEVVEKEGKSYWGMGARKCDSCKVTPALLFCRADSAFLCSACDSKVHSANKLASRHERVWMCEVCEQAPASVTCKADAAALCITCDADIHSANPLARRHERFPVVPFLDSSKINPPKTTNLQRKSPSKDEERDDEDDDEEDKDDEEEAEAEAASWLLPSTGMVNPKELHHDMKPVVDQYFFSDVDPYLDLDYAASIDPRFRHNDSIVPVQTRGVPVAVGVAAQIHHNPTFLGVPDTSYEIDFTRSKHSYSYAPSLSHSVSSSEVGVVPDGSAMTDISNPYIAGGGVAAANQAATMGSTMTPATTVIGLNREARVLRYREKRKNRRFEKTIRYASRKAYAETRPRIKGRFAKRTEMECENDIVTSTFMIDHGYGVVPSF